MLDIPFRNGVALVYVSFTIFIFNCCRLMESPHSPIVYIYVITITSSTSVRMYLLAPSSLIWAFHSNGQKWNSLECSMPYWSFVRNISHSQQHPLLIPRLHLSTCLLWLLKALDLVVLISCFVAHEQVENFLCLLQGTNYPCSLFANPTCYFVAYSKDCQVHDYFELHGPSL